MYVLLASPFARFGFTGIKVFNALTTLLTLFFTFKSAVYLKLKNPAVSVVILIFSPLYYILTFSGLTEPLFALFLSTVLYTVLRKKYITACIILSFLPFVRSEGLIIIGIFIVYLFMVKKWKMVPWLLSGHIVYAIAGFFVYHDLFWVISRIPYAHLSSTYGSGSLFHFTEQMMYVTGVPVYILCWTGVVGILWRSCRKEITPELLIFVFPGFLFYLAAHSLFWYLGIFNSMGLKRVLIGVMPFIAILSLYGYNFITEDLLKFKRNLILPSRR